MKFVISQSRDLALGHRTVSFSGEFSVFDLQKLRLNEFDRKALDSIQDDSPPSEILRALAILYKASGN